MLAFGRHNPFPFRFGGGDSTVEIEEQALLDALAPAFDPSDDTAHFQEIHADAIAVASIWEMNGRLANQVIPMRMLEALTTWEEATRTNPTSGDLDIERRKRVAAKLRGLSGNALPDIEETCRALLGSTFVAVHSVDDADRMFYWPAGPSTPSGDSAPGPPGYEWSSNVAHLQIEVTKNALDDDEFNAKMAALENTLDALLPAWMTCTWHTGSGFIVSESLLGEQAL